LRQQLDEAKSAQEQAEAQAKAREEPTEPAATAQEAVAEEPTATGEPALAVGLPQAEVPRAEPAVIQTNTPVAEPAPVEAGQLVEPGPGVTPPRIVNRPSPRYPPSARRLGKVATVQLRVLVDENGHVLETERIGADVGFGFDQEALAAARSTTWRPAMKSGVPVKMWIDLRIEFRP
jgi:protein TonB